MLKYVLAALVVAIATLESAPAQEVTLKLSAFIPPQAPTFAQVIKPWAEAVNAEGKGVIKIDTFPGGVLGGNPGLQPKMVVDGIADIALVIPAYSPGRFPDNDVMELPSMAQNSTESSIAIYRLYQRQLLRGYEDFYVVMLGTTNPYAIHTRRPVKTFADVKGMKLRAGGPVASASLRALGVAPVGMPITQVAENVSRGLLDGTGGDWDVMYSFRIIETANHHYMASVLGTVPVAILMSRKVYEALPEKARSIINKHSGEPMSRRFGAVHDGIQKAKHAETVAAADHTMVFPPAAELAQLEKILASVTESWEKDHPNGRVLAAALKEELAKVRAGQ
ncbi:MAG TPA: TRAP transporter substrate-binding protein [Hyphomicrobiaceae bacterium]|jgi:TRAP-type C4-dicarboxylate transport system substrate-binding protein|nr:TRAP transporter substrate-binding protein [Hyphomicrobiaceae bacterium]